ncbi:HD-GYP domain-containing protein, partial [Candidatus Latescibacterota bacterium]
FFLHDIGKSLIPIRILNKKGTLSSIEWEIIKEHPDKGYRLLEKFGTISEEIEIIVLQHHERHDGNGYPRGLKGEQIHIYAKICMIADVFDALTSYRPYKEKYSTFDALKIMKNEMYKNFNPEFFEKFAKLFLIPEINSNGDAKVTRETQQTKVYLK